MRTTHPPTSKINRLSRLIIWAQAILIWAAAVFLGESLINRRHIRQRYGALNIAKLAHLVRNLMIIRAAHFLRRRNVAPRRYFAPPGFRQRHRAFPLRAIAGSRLRRFLTQGNCATRITRFVQIVRNLDAFVRKFLVRRAQAGINRQSPIVMVQPARDRVHSLAAQAPLLADSS